VSNNLVLLRGRVTSEPRIRQLPSGSAIVNLELTTRDGDVASSVPVVLEGAEAGCVAGEDVVVLGHVRRRFFRAGGVTQSRTEVLAERLVAASRHKTVERLVATALASF
jgi:single-strand DNA-binding protein